MRVTRFLSLSLSRFVFFFPFFCIGSETEIAKVKAKAKSETRVAAVNLQAVSNFVKRHRGLRYIYCA